MSARCRKTLAALQKRELSGLLFNYPTSDPTLIPNLAVHPEIPSLSDVAARLEAGGYATDIEFETDVRCILNEFTTFFEAVRTRDALLWWSVAADVLEKFEKNWKKYAKSDAELRKETLLKQRTAAIHLLDRGGDDLNGLSTMPGSYTWDHDLGIPSKVNPQRYY
jgi:hypothetical protein